MLKTLFSNCHILPTESRNCVTKLTNGAASLWSWHSLRCSTFMEKFHQNMQKPSTGPYPEPTESNLSDHISIILFRKNHANIISPFTIRSPKCFCPLDFPTKNVCRDLIFLVRATRFTVSYAWVTYCSSICWMLRLWSSSFENYLLPTVTSWIVGLNIHLRSSLSNTFIYIKPEDEDSMYLRNVCICLQVYTR